MTDVLAELAILVFLAGTLLAGIVRGPAVVLPRALTVALFLLPSAASFTIPGPIPPLDKFAAVGLPALVLLLAGGNELKRLRPLSSDLLAFAFLGLLAFSTLRANGLYPAGSRLAGLLVNFLLPYLVGRIWVRTPEQLDRLLGLFVLLALIQVPFMLAEFFVGPFLTPLVYGIDIDYGQSARFGFYRPYLFFRHALELGNVMALALGAALARRCWRIQQRRRQSPWEGLQIGLLGLGVLLSMSRGPILGAGLMLAGFFLFGRRAWFFAWALGIGGVLFFLWMLGQGSALSVASLLDLQGGELGQTLAYRFLQVDVYAQMFWHRPLFGFGNPVPRDYWVPIIDGILLLLVLEGGVLSMGAYAAWILELARRAQAGVVAASRSGLAALFGGFFAAQLGWLLFSAWGDAYIGPFHLFLGGALAAQTGGIGPVRTGRSGNAVET